VIKCLIFDLDRTLIDTSALEVLRSQQNWSEVRNNHHLCTVFNDALDALNLARSAGIKIAIATNSPSAYASGLLKHFNIHIDHLTAYHDVTNHKPAPDCVNRVLQHFDIDCSEAVYLGDSDADYGASTNAGVEFFAVEWGDVSRCSGERTGVQRLISYLGRAINDEDRASLPTEVIQRGNHYFLGYYLPGISQEVWSFKDGLSDAVARWTAKSSSLVDMLPNIDYVVRALGHAETEVDEAVTQKPLDQLGLALSSALGAEYRPSFLTKDRELKKSTKCSAKERNDQVAGAYSFVSSPENTDSDISFLVIDDVLTSGATTNEIVRAINSSFPNGRVYLFTLAKTLYREEGKTDSAEARHNTQLFIDLYSKQGKSENQKVIFNKTEDQPKISVTNKSFSANYGHTNHNFIIQNIRRSSIASEPKSDSILDCVYVLKNLLQRGKPTLASLYLRNRIGLGIDDYLSENKPQCLISREPVNWRRLIRGDVSNDFYPAKYFFDKLVPKYFGQFVFLKQLMLPEVQIYEITQVYVGHFNNRQVDFYIPQIGMIIEIDGNQHRSAKDSDSKRDGFTSSLGLTTIRFTTDELATESSHFINKIEIIKAHCREVDKLEREGVLVPPNGIRLEHYKSAFEHGVDYSNPNLLLCAVMRFQMTILELIENGQVRLGAETTVLLINRDNLDFARLAVDDLNRHLKELFILRGLPELNLLLDIIEVEEDKDDLLETDIIVDFSVLQRYDDKFQTSPETIFVRTHYLDFYRYYPKRSSTTSENCLLRDYDFFEMSCSKPVTYELDLSPDSRQRTALRYFLRNIFLPSVEDADFREGQIGIIGSALARKGTIGLLPTGSGKSICYQLAALLQPAISFVVCPIKSLMYDQKTDLDAIGITRTNFITSELKPDEKHQIQSDYGRGKYFFVFISPERFQTHTFRSEMLSIGLDSAFAYAVIDEAHCLSEWGHDFRTSYLNLSNTITRLAPEARYIGLTATASVNVLKDMQAEFGIPDENVRTPLNFTREELSFHVIDDNGMKVDALINLVTLLDGKWNVEDKDQIENRAGIVFTPTVNGDKGCFELAGRLQSSLNQDVRYFSGSAPKKGTLKGGAFDSYKRDVQNDFKANKYRLLTATKAFGMGVNKGNIAYTVHHGIPGSMEALYQEAGRAGRNKKLFIDGPADCYVLLSKENNAGVLDQIWDVSTTVKQLKEAVRQLSRSSDVNTNLFLMTSNQDTINTEFQLMRKIYQYILEQKSNGLIEIRASNFSVEKNKLEKSIYRFFQLGIVTDWTVIDFFQGNLEIEFNLLSDNEIQDHLEGTISKYDSKFTLSSVFESSNDYYQVLTKRYEDGKIDRVELIFLVLLLWSYDHFAYNRRQSLKTVYEHCGDLASKSITNAEFKNRLEGYFKFNESTHLLNHLAENHTNLGRWLDLFFEEEAAMNSREIISDDQIITIKEQLSRFLESYKDNICLNYLSGIMRLIDDQFDDTDGERRMALSLDKLRGKDTIEIEILLRDTLELEPLFSMESKTRFSRLFYSKYPGEIYLRLINDRFADPYSSRMLIEPLVNQLDDVLSKFKEIKW
jgi:ATP-dependent DNA helicase RecQ